MKNLIRKILRESVKLPIEIGDTVYMGKFKNKKTVVKDIEWNEKGDLMINGKSALRVRIPKKVKKLKEETDSDWDWMEDTHDYGDNILSTLDDMLKYKVWFGDSLTQEQQLKVLEDLDEKFRQYYHTPPEVMTWAKNLHQGTTYTSLFINHLKEYDRTGNHPGWNVSHMGCTKTERRYIDADDYGNLGGFCLPEDDYKLDPKKIESDREYFDESTDYLELPKDLFL